MTEINKAKVTVDELLQAVRSELAKTQGYIQTNNTIINEANQKFSENISYIETLVNNAESRTHIRTKWPDKYNRFPFNFSSKFQKLVLKALQIIFVDQREVNFSLIQSLRKSILVNQQLSEEIVELKNHIKTYAEKVDTISDRYNSDIEKFFKIVEQNLSSVEDRAEKLSDRDNKTNNKLEKLTEQLNNLHKLHFNESSYLKNDLSQQKRLITLFLEKARQSSSNNFEREQIQKFDTEEQHLLDTFYVDFEAQFRGSWEEISNRLKVYLPWIEKAKVGTKELPILDIGCGRGEWLELLQSSGFVARGLDINRIMVEQCRVRGFDIVEGDALSYLQSLPAGSLGAITGFHIIEHLPFNLLIKLLYETNRVLASGGIAIFETPNPDNVIVGSSSFYLDPTHNKPLPSQTIKFVVEFCDFCNVQILNLNRADIPRVSDSSELAQRFNEYFYGCRDYAVIGFKA